MAGITGLGTTYNLPNYSGILYQVSPTDTPFFSAIGGLNAGGGQTVSKEYEWQTSDLRDPGQNTALEGADAPTAVERVRANVTNVVEIHQSQVAVSYTKLAAVGQKDGVNNEATNPVRNELDWQVEQELTSIARDVNYSLLRGTYQLPTDNTTARQTRGLLNAITTNSRDYSEGTTAGATATASTDNIGFTGHGLVAGDQIVITAITDGAPLTTGRVYWVSGTVAANTFQVALEKDGPIVDITTNGTAITYQQLRPLTLDHLNSIMQAIYDAGGVSPSPTRAFMVPPHLKLAVSKAIASAYGQYQETSRTVGGVDMSTVVTDFGTLNVVIERLMPAGTIAAVALEQCMPVYLDIPGKGTFFAEPLAKTGASEKVQMYGEVGLAYGNERAHAQAVYLGSQ